MCLEMVEEEEVVVGLEVVVVVVDVVVVGEEEVVGGEIASHFFHWQGFSILAPLSRRPLTNANSAPFSFAIK